MTSTEEANKPCRERVGKQMHRRMDDIRLLVAADMAGVDDFDDDEQIAERLGDWDHKDVVELRQLSPLHEYGLALTYEADEMNDGQNAHFCWLLSTGGPHEEIRFFVNNAFRLQRVEFVLKDWFDVASIEIDNEKGNFDTTQDLWNNWRDCGLPEHLIEQERRQR